MSVVLVVVASDALVASVKRRQVEVCGIVHTVNAHSAGLALGRTTVVTFGGAKAGTLYAAPLMQAHQTLLGLDLPLCNLVYETGEG